MVLLRKYGNFVSRKGYIYQLLTYQESAILQLIKHHVNLKSDEWLLFPTIFNKLKKICELPEINMFPSRLTKQLDTCTSWMPSQLFYN